MDWLTDTDVIRWVAVICTGIVLAGLLHALVVWRRYMPPLLVAVSIAAVLLLIGVAVGVVANMTQPLPPTPGQAPPGPSLQLPPTRAVKWTSGFGTVAALLVLWALIREWLDRRRER